MKSAFFFLLFCVPALALSGATSQAYDRYQTIVTRQMFGPLPPNFDPDKMPSEVARSSSAAEKQLTQEQEQIRKAIRFMAINKAADGAIMVGFADFGDPKNPLTYYLKVGESQNGWTVREADLDTAVMTIVNKEGVEVTLKLGGNSATDVGAVSKGGASPAAAPASSETGTRAGGALFGSLRERRRQREAQAAAAEKERADREAEREKQREADREEQRRQLQDLKDEIQRMNEARAAASQPKASEKDAEKENSTPKQETVQ